ncbi:hypothetical protein N7512_000204 [Penicillium capsulatum]|nr:hypothetical protein N7512_000204 [Penicillium capsulatum]
MLFDFNFPTLSPDMNRNCILHEKVARQHAKERNADLRDLYLHNLSNFQSYHLVYVDESGCGKRAGYRRLGWSPLGVTPLQVS